MYAALFFILFALGAATLLSGAKSEKAFRISIGAAIILLTLVFMGFLSFWGEYLWFEALGYSDRFWTVVLAKVGFACLGLIAGWLLLYLMLLGTPKEKRMNVRIGATVGALVGAGWGYQQWETILIFLNRVQTSVTDPILNLSTSFYLFALPFYDALYQILFFLVLAALLASASIHLLRFQNGDIKLKKTGNKEEKTESYFSIYLNFALLLFVLSYGMLLNRYHLMYSTKGVVTGVGWTDVNLRLPAYLIVAVLTVLGGIIALAAPLRNGLVGRFIPFPRSTARYALSVAGAIGGALIVLWILGLSIIPGLFQWLRVEPNEITFEKPYIEHNIRFTRQGFNLDQVEEREFPARETVTRQTIENNPYLKNNVRLWDWRALDSVLKQFQEIRLYYEFHDVDIDRYTFGGNYRQVMVSPREMKIENLPEQSQTFVNERFKYTHGNGITLNTVSDFTPQGLPNLLVKDIPPQSEFEELKVEQPRIYYGEMTQEHVIVNTREKEFDYPSGEKNVYIRYSGSGGVQLSSLWRKFLYGWLFDGTRFFLSNYPTRDSRIMFHRQIQERVNQLAPFLEYDKDPYIVLADGKLYWIIDAYTTSAYYPYSEPYSARRVITYKEGERDRQLINYEATQLNGVNYLRNSVKIVIDAFEGSVDFYIFDEEDPVIQVWDNIFPSLFKNKEEMPAELMNHIRYPSDFLVVQGLVYAKYHMSDPTVFYNQEDLWIRATEKYYNQVQPVEPYYIMWQRPQSDQVEFVLMLPFTPKNRQVLIGWIAGMCDPGNYGRFLAYQFPKEKRILGPQQVETKIDQDRFLSGQLTLWDQRGSQVIRGNVLAIPIDETLLYVEPIYLQSETAAYPELRLVIVMHNDILSYGHSFEEALQGLFEQGRISRREEALPSAEVGTIDQLIQQANEAFENYLESLGNKNYEEAGRALKKLESTLGNMKTQGRSSGQKGSPEK